jgi:SIR2-like domain
MHIGTYMDKISEMAGHISGADGKVSFIIGAGASKAAGIPLANELMEIVFKKFPHCVSTLNETDKKYYGRVMSRLSPQEREALIEPLLKNAKINWGQIAVASMLQGGFVGRVLSFNFDLVLERAAALLGLQVPVYDFAIAPSNAITRLARPSIIHLHGQSAGLLLLNTEDETRRHKEALRPLLTDTVRNEVTVVAGYSGEADGALDLIQEAFNSNTRLLWLGRNDTAPAHLQKLLAKNYADYFSDCDFDITMIKLAREKSYQIQWITC